MMRKLFSLVGWIWKGRENKTKGPRIRGSGGQNALNVSRHPLREVKREMARAIWSFRFESRRKVPHDSIIYLSNK
jgi:hypothetical protein